MKIKLRFQELSPNVSPFRTTKVFRVVGHADIVLGMLKHSKLLSTYAYFPRLTKKPYLLNVGCLAQIIKKLDFLNSSPPSPE